MIFVSRYFIGGVVEIPIGVKRQKVILLAVIYLGILFNKNSYLFCVRKNIRE